MDISTEEKRELFQFIKDNNETLFSLLYGAEYVTLENGKLIPHLYTEEEIKKGGGVGGHFYKIRNQGTNRSV